MPVKKAEANPWTIVCVDLIGSCTIKTKNGPRQLLAMTIIDPETSWIEIVPLDNKRATTAAEAFDCCWLCRDPHPPKKS